jgi:hypothetical protein
MRRASREKIFMWPLVCSDSRIVAVTPSTGVRG